MSVTIGLEETQGWKTKRYVSKESYTDLEKRYTELVELVAWYFECFEIKGWVANISNWYRRNPIKCGLKDRNVPIHGRVEWNIDEGFIDTFLEAETALREFVKEVK